MAKEGQEQAFKNSCFDDEMLHNPGMQIAANRLQRVEVQVSVRKMNNQRKAEKNLDLDRQIATMACSYLPFILDKAPG